MEIKRQKIPHLYVICSISQDNGEKCANELMHSLSSTSKVELLSKDRIDTLIHLKCIQDSYAAISRLVGFLLLDRDVIIHIDCITHAKRMQLLKNVPSSCFKTCYVINDDLQIDDRMKQFEIPYYEEGWNAIKLSNIIGARDSALNYNDLIRKTFAFDQYSKYHNLTLDEHHKAVEKYITSKSEDLALIEAASIHDIGKIFTQTFKPNKEAQYIAHANVGAYKLISSFMYWIMPEDEQAYIDEALLLDIAFYINYHMAVRNMNSKNKDKYLTKFGEDKLMNLLLLDEADLASHTV